MGENAWCTYMEDDRIFRYLISLLDAFVVSALLILFIVGKIHGYSVAKTPPAEQIADFETSLDPMIWIIIIWFVTVVARVSVFAFGSHDAKDELANLLSEPFPQTMAIGIFFIGLLLMGTSGSFVAEIQFTFSFINFNKIPVLKGYTIDPYNTFNATPIKVYDDYMILSVTTLHSMEDVNSYWCCAPEPEKLIFDDFRFLGGRNLTYIEWMFVETMKNNHSTAYLYIINFPSTSQLHWYLKWLPLVGFNPDKSVEVEHAFIESVPGNWIVDNGVYYTVYDNNTYAVTTFGSTVVALVVYNATLPVDAVVQYLLVGVGSLLNH